MLDNILAGHCGVTLSWCLQESPKKHSTGQKIVELSTGNSKTSGFPCFQSLCHHISACPIMCNFSFFKVLTPNRSTRYKNINRFLDLNMWYLDTAK